MMVGDGVNDVFVFLGVDVGIVIGVCISEVVFGGVDVVLMMLDFGCIFLMLCFVEFIWWIVIVNVVLGIGFLILMMVLVLVGVIDLLVGVFLYNVGVIFVIMNSLWIVCFVELEEDCGFYIGFLLGEYYYYDDDYYYYYYYYVESGLGGVFNIY